MINREKVIVGLPVFALRFPQNYFDAGNQEFLHASRVGKKTLDGSTVKGD